MNFEYNLLQMLKSIRVDICFLLKLYMSVTIKCNHWPRKIAQQKVLRLKKIPNHCQKYNFWGHLSFGGKSESF